MLMEHNENSRFTFTANVSGTGLAAAAVQAKGMQF
jgi:hypothetical protein